MDRHRGRLAGPKEPLGRIGDAPILHLRPNAVVASGIDQRAGEHDPPRERLRPVVGEHDVDGHRPVPDGFRIPAGGVDVALDAEPVGLDDAGQRIARLHPFPLVRKDLDDSALEGSGDRAPLDGLLGSLDLHRL